MANASDNTSATELPENMRIKCKYCPKTFATAQAFGGHQNAHREEKWNQKIQRQALLAHLNKSNPNPHPYPQASLNQHAAADIPYEMGSYQHAFPAEFEQPHYGRPENVAVVYNYGSQSSNFLGRQSYPNQVVYNQNNGQSFNFAGQQSYPNQVVYNQYNGQNFNFVGQQSYPSQEMSPDWTFAGNPIRPQPQPQPQTLMDPSSPVNLDICLGIKNTSQEPNNITKEMVPGKEDDGSSFSLSINEKEDDGPSLSLSLGEKEDDDPSLSLKL